jgi:glycosyltransferase involved in cell wall biosynthesis
LKSLPTTSVIIPTHNRKDSLLRTLDSLGQQTFPMDRLVVVVVDDGSTDDTQTIASQQFPFTFRYVQQKNQGATAARNYGATISQSEILVFIDDDITISPQSLEAVAETCGQRTKVLAMGTIHKRSSVSASVYTPMLSSILLIVIRNFSRVSAATFLTLACFRTRPGDMAGQIGTMLILDIGLI